MVRTPPRELTVPSALGGERLDRAMAALAPEISRGEARRLIAAGVVFVGSKRTGIASRLVRAGERLSWEPPASAPSRSETGVEPRVVVERPELWIIDKPAGMPVEATRAGKRGTLAAWLGHGHGTAYVTHRLDAATSGLVVVARDRDAQAALNRLFAAHAIGRRYLAVVAPAPPWAELTMDAPLDGRAAVTHATVVARAALAAALVVRLETGRSRQIRRHLAAAGFPVVGETATGARTSKRLLLHAFELRVPWNVPGPEGGTGKTESAGTTAGTGASDSTWSTDGTLAVTAPPPVDFLRGAAALGVSASDLELRMPVDVSVASVAETDP